MFLEVSLSSATTNFFRVWWQATEEGFAMEMSRVRLELFWQKPCTRMVEAPLALLLLFLVLLAVVVVTITLLKKT